MVELGKGLQHQRELLFHIVGHVVVGSEGRLRGVQVEPRTQTEVVGALEIVRDPVPPGARIRSHQGQAQGGCRPLRPGLRNEVLIRAGEPGKPVNHRHGVRSGLGRQINGEGHGTAQRLRGVLKAQLPPAKAGDVA